MAEDRLVSEIYLVKGWQFSGAKQIAYIMGDLGAGRAAWSHENDKVTDRFWKPDNHHFDITTHKDKRKRNIVIFRNHRYLNDSGVVYGKPLIIAEEKEEVDGSAQTYDNSLYDSVSHETYSYSLLTGSTVSHTMNEAHEVSIKSETTIKGSYSGVEFEQKFEAAYGFKLSKSQTEEESKQVTETLTDQFDVKARQIVVASLERESLIVETPYEVNAIFDCGLHLDFEDWAGIGKRLWGGKRHDNKFEFDNMLAFERFLKGYDVRYPQMSDYKPSDDAKRAMAWLFDSGNRLVQGTGVKRRIYDKSIRIRKVTVKNGNK